ncbi:hypothetical protein M106_2832 [Bacteroides fragilis str. 1009-4-F |nr:hypothetical protein M106_2832 [Bacteroides fragilis str. 1009-4-F \
MFVGADFTKNKRESFKTLFYYRLHRFIQLIFIDSRLFTFDAV